MLVLIRSIAYDLVNTRLLVIVQMSRQLKRTSLHCRRILGGRKLPVYVRKVVTAIFDVMTQED